MKRFKKLVFLIISVLTFIILWDMNSNQVEASSGNLYLNHLDFQAQVNSDGSMDVTEKWDIEIEDTNTLYKTFKVDENKYSSITDVVVTEISEGTYKTLEKSYDWHYHMPEGSYYGGLNNKGENEIAWGVGLEDSEDTRTYLISYHVTDAIAKYSDYAELYWQFVGKDFEISARQITGTVRLPNGASDFNAEKIKIWGHTEDLNGTITLNSENEIKFEINRFRAGKYVEIRTLFPTELIYYTNREQHKDILQSVLNEETIWANKANARRESRKRMSIILRVLYNIAIFIISIFVIKPILKTRKEVKESKKIVPTQKFEYYREIPRKDATPAEALAIYKKEIGAFNGAYDIGQIFTATLLDLSLKKYIQFEQQDKEMKIILVKTEIGYDIKNLTGEIEIFRFLKGIFEKQKQNEITLKEIKKYIRKESNKVIKLKEKIDKTTEEALYKKDLANKENKEKKAKLNEKIALVTLGLVFFIIIMCVILAFVLTEKPKLAIWYLIISIIPIFILIWYIVEKSRLSKKTEVLTQEGIDEQEKWKGLKKFMEEFSMLDKREIPELVLWEHFLVYATVFKIADKVLKQLKIIYPNFNEQIDANTYSCMHIMMNTDFSSSFSNSISTTMSTTYSSASGGGGGFSGGGGGRWPEVAGGGGR